jgi:hypothetical protein
MMKTKLQKFHHTIHHTNLKAANLRSVLGNAFSPGNNTIVENVPTPPRCRMLRLDEDRLVVYLRSIVRVGLGEKLQLFL